MRMSMVVTGQAPRDEKKSAAIKSRWQSKATQAMHAERKEHSEDTSTRFAIGAIQFMADAVNSNSNKNAIHLDHKAMFSNISGYLQGFFQSPELLASGVISLSGHESVSIVQAGQARTLNRTLSESSKIIAKAPSQKTFMTPSQQQASQALKAIDSQTHSSTLKSAISKCQTYLKGQMTQGLSSDEKQSLLSEPQFDAIAMDPDNGLDVLLSGTDKDSFSQHVNTTSVDTSSKQPEETDEEPDDRESEGMGSP